MDDLRLHTLGAHAKRFSANLTLGVLTSFLGLVRGLNIWNSLSPLLQKTLVCTPVDTSVDSTNPPETGTKGLLADAIGARDGPSIPTRNCHQASICNRPWLYTFFSRRHPMYHTSPDRSRDVENVLPVFERIHTRARLVSHRRTGRANASHSNCPLFAVDWVDRCQGGCCFGNPARFLNLRLKSSTQQA